MSHRGKIKSSVGAGFTLVELMITLTIAAVLATLAAPSFRDYISSQRIKDGSYDLIAAMVFARSEALKRNTSVDVVPASTANWASGWTVQVTVGGTTTTLRKQDAKSGVSITVAGNPTKLTYGNDGRVTVTTLTGFTVDLASPLSGVPPRCVTIGPSGTPSSKLGTCS